MATYSSGSDILSILHQSAKKGTLLASCEPEIKELMRHIDILLSTKNQDQIDTLKHQVKSRDRDVASLRYSLHEKNTEIEKLRNELSQTQHNFKVKSSNQETQLLRLRSELNRLSKCYEKLKNRKSKLESTPAEDQDIHTIDSKILKEAIVSVQKQCDSYEEQLKENSDSIRELECINQILRDNLNVKEKEMDKVKIDLEESLMALQERDSALENKEQYYKSILESKDKKINSLKKERDESRSQTKNALTESEKWYNQLQEFSVQNKEWISQVEVTGVKINELQNTLKKMNAENFELKNNIGTLQESLISKDTYIKNLQEQYTEKLKDEGLHHKQELKTLQMTLKTLNMDKKKLIDENMQLKKKTSNSSRSSLEIESEIKLELDKRESEINNYRLQLLKKDTLLQSLQERVSHLEDLLSEATTELNSHQNSIDIECATNVYTNDTSTASNKELNIDKPRTSKPGTSNTDTPNRGRIVMEDQTNDTVATSNKELLLEEFQKKLSCIMSEHFSHMDQSIQKALSHSIHN